MMLEIFKYTERVVNMVRPRKLLVIAIGARCSSRSNSGWEAHGAQTASHLVPR